jgi:hypothetical protein
MYGFVIGGAIADSMGAVIDYAPNHIMNNPLDSRDVGIKPGYWTEPTGLFLARSQSVAVEVSVDDLVPESCTGSEPSPLQCPLLSRLIQGSAIVLAHRTYLDQLKAVDKVGGDDAMKLWISILDGIINNTSKKTTLDPSVYQHLDLSPDILDVLRSARDSDLVVDSDSEPELQILKEVLQVFKQTNSFVEGLRVIINQSVNPSWAGALYGQLAGAYYGLTDIPEEWMDHLERSDQLIATTMGRIA